MTAKFQPGLASTVMLGSESHATSDYILLSNGSGSFQTPKPETLDRVRVTLRLAVYRQSDRLGDKPLETHDQ
jgi:hypothetical protein